MPRVNSTPIPDRAGMPSPDDVTDGVLEAFTAAGYVTDGTKDKNKLRTRIVEIVSEAIVTSDTKKDREDHAVRLTTMVSQLFPGLPESDEDDGGLAAAVYRRVRQDVWNQLQVGSRSPVQKAMQNGSVLQRTRLGADRVHAVYVTSNLKAIVTDTLDHQIAIYENRVNRDVEDRMDLIRRLSPADAKRVMATWAKESKRIEAAGREKLAAALETKLAGEITAGESEPSEPEQAA